MGLEKNIAKHLKNTQFGAAREILTRIIIGFLLERHSNLNGRIAGGNHFFFV